MLLRLNHTCKCSGGNGNHRNKWCNYAWKVNCNRVNVSAKHVETGSFCDVSKTVNISFLINESAWSLPKQEIVPDVKNVDNMAQEFMESPCTVQRAHCLVQGKTTELALLRTPRSIEVKSFCNTENPACLARKLAHFVYWMLLYAPKVWSWWGVASQIKMLVTKGGFTKQGHVELTVHRSIVV